MTRGSNEGKRECQRRDERESEERGGEERQARAGALPSTGREGGAPVPLLRSTRSPNTARRCSNLFPGEREAASRAVVSSMSRVQKHVSFASIIGGEVTHARASGAPGLFLARDTPLLRGIRWNTVRDGFDSGADVVCSTPRGHESRVACAGSLGTRYSPAAASCSERVNNVAVATGAQRRACSDRSISF